MGAATNGPAHGHPARCPVKESAMRARSSPSLVTLLLASVSLLAPAARADWAPGGIRVSTSDSAKFTPCAVPDGAGGAFIAWIEESGLDRLVHAQHLTSEGNVAPGW